MLDSLTQNLIWAIIAFAGGFVFQRSRTWWTQTRPAHQLWPAGKGSRVEIVMTTSPIRHDEEITELVYPAEASAANEINTFLTKALHLDGRLQLSHRFRHEQLSENLVVIGGPVHNELTAQLIDDLRPEWHFEDHDFLAPDGKRFRSEIESHSSSTVRDFGILVRAKSPYESERWVTLVMGCHTWGCMIAARSMIDENVSKTSRLISGAKQFVFVCSAPIVGGVVQSVQMEDLWTY